MTREKMASEKVYSEGLGFFEGQRVHNVNNPEQMGTIKYIGEVQGYQGVWIGVDWDSGQGRHNGTVDGRFYFQARGEKSGSLVRPNSLSAGVTLLEALVRRYVPSDPNSLNSPKEEEDGMYVMSTRHRRMPVELVGKSQIEERQKQLGNLLIASLPFAGVNSPGPEGGFRSVVPNLRELDLTGNLLPDWVAVGKLFEELPKIDALNLSNSRLGMRTDMRMPRFNMRTLVLNSCEITWKQVEQLKGCLSGVEELHLCGNKISTIELPSEMDARVEGFDSLHLLNLEDNNIADWGEVLKLTKLKSLEHLNLNSNNLQDIYYPAFFSPLRHDKEGIQETDPSSGAHVLSFGTLRHDKEGTQETDPNSGVHFLSLRCLLLGRNSIAGWASIDALDKFPNLQELRLSENPITNTANGGAARYILIARIRKITMLNGSEIKPKERRDAEVRYVRYALSSSSVTGGTVQELEKLHPRLAELRLAHDIPVESVQLGAEQVSQKMSATLLSINILCVASSLGERALVTKRLPASTTVGKLKLICEGLFKLRAARQRLFAKDQDLPLPVPLDNDLESLNDLSLGAGAVILLDEADGF